MRRVLSCVLFTLVLSTSVHGTEITSPDGKIHARFLKQKTEKQSTLQYTILYENKTIINNSPIRFTFADQSYDINNFKFRSAKITNHDSTWSPVYGERQTIRDHYNQMVLSVLHSQTDQHLFDITIRAYDEGIAFCYTFPKRTSYDSLTLQKEHTEFHFQKDHTAWATYSAQGLYEEVPISKIRKGCERPLTIKIDEGLFIALAEARLVDYARTKFDSLNPDRPALVTSLASQVEMQLPYTTPWRVIMIAESPGQLLENNHLILNLNDPCAISDPSWIKPGKVIREVSLTTQGGKACVDFASRHNLHYVEYDAGWYGHEYDDSSDATTISVDPKRSPGPLDLHEVIRYANQKGIGIIVYVNRRALEKQLDDILPLYQKWGIKGVKYGFVNVGSQHWTKWLHEAVRKAAKHKLMVDIHDEYRPTGYSRTYPNLMTQEGIRGDETRPTNDQTLTTLFTRMLAGAGDNTICYYDNRVTQNASHAYQLAKAVCFYSPWQFIYWYDRPAEIEKEHDPEIEFFDDVPTVWDETKVLFGAIGEYAVIARRSGEEWFIGCMNAENSQDFKVDLSFLDPKKTYLTKIYSTDQTIETRTHVKIEERKLDSNDQLKIHLPSNDGQALHLIPQKNV